MLKIGKIHRQFIASFCIAVAGIKERILEKEVYRCVPYLVWL